MKVLAAVLCCSFALIGCALGDANTNWNKTDVDILKDSLLEGYDEKTRPSDSKTPTKLFLGITIMSFDLTESTGILTTHAWINMNWTDTKLKWEPEKHNGIKQLHVTADEIWTPDLTLYNSNDEQIMDHFVKTNKIVLNDGGIIWVPPAKFESYCEMDLKLWPYDEQTCEIKFGSWTYDSTQISLHVASKPISLEYYKHLDWEVVESKAEYHKKLYDCCPEPYEDVTFYFTIAHKSSMYKFLAIAPAVTLAFMVLVTFWLHPQSGEKLVVNGIAALIATCMLVYFSQLFPVAAKNPPLIVCFYSCTLYLIAVSFILSVLVIGMSRKTSQCEVPKVIKSVFLGNFIETIFACTSSAKSEKKEVEDGAVENSANDWTRVAVVIDRIAFLVYAILFLCFAFCR